LPCTSILNSSAWARSSSSIVCASSGATPAADASFFDFLALRSFSLSLSLSLLLLAEDEDEDDDDEEEDEVVEPDRLRRLDVCLDRDRPLLLFFLDRLWSSSDSESEEDEDDDEEEDEEEEEDETDGDLLRDDVFFLPSAFLSSATFSLCACSTSRGSALSLTVSDAVCFSLLSSFGAGFFFCGGGEGDLAHGLRVTGISCLILALQSAHSSPGSAGGMPFVSYCVLPLSPSTRSYFLRS
jgi:hypothetical protein